MSLSEPQEPQRPHSARAALAQLRWARSSAGWALSFFLEQGDPAQRLQAAQEMAPLLRSWQTLVGVVRAEQADLLRR